MKNTSYIIFLVVFVVVFFSIQLLIFDQGMSSETVLTSLIAGFLSITILFFVERMKSKKKLTK